MHAWESAIGHQQARLATTAGLPYMLAAGFDTFELIRVAAETCQDQAGPAFATWAMTSAEAAAGCYAIAGALPSPSGSARTAATALPLEQAAAAVALAGLAARLAACMAATARSAASGGQVAFELAAAHLARITDLLIGAG